MKGLNYLTSRLITKLALSQGRVALACKQIYYRNRIWGPEINPYTCSHITKKNWGTSLAVQWLRLHASTAGGAGSIPGGGTKILHAVWCGQKKKNFIEIKFI